jgi:hypothetical protein
LPCVSLRLHVIKRSLEFCQLHLGPTKRTYQGPQRASGGSEGLGVGEDGREAPQQTDGAQGASGNWSITVADGEFN